MERLYWEESYQINGALYEVYNVLGPGFLEKVYQEALEREFILRGIPYEREGNHCKSYTKVILLKTNTLLISFALTK